MRQVWDRIGLFPATEQRLTDETDSCDWVAYRDGNWRNKT